MGLLSTKAVYGLAAMHVLANSPHDRCMQVKEIAALTKISAAYLEQLLSVLRRSGLVSSIRGAMGGYKLAKDANFILVIDIVEALEGQFYKMEGNLGSSIVLEAFWDEIEKKLKHVCKNFEANP